MSIKEWTPPDKPILGVHKRKKLTRPNFSVICVMLDFLCPLILLVIGAYYLLEKSMLTAEQTKTFLLFAFVGYVVFRIRQVILWIILIYQKYAPDNIRLACVFEPSCSEYMYQAIIKYGLVAGVLCGIKRLLRCHDPNGGFDKL